MSLIKGNSSLRNDYILKAFKSRVRFYVSRVAEAEYSNDHLMFGLRYIYIDTSVKCRVLIGPEPVL